MSERKEENNFASAVMMRLIAAGLERQGLGARLRPARGAHVPRQSKQVFLERLGREHGLKSILALADAVADMPPEPVVLALTKAKGLEDLFSRWHRIETFSHASHTVEVARSGAGTWRLSHVSKRRGESPTIEESLLVAAVLTKVGEMICDAPLTLRSAMGATLRDRTGWSEPQRALIDGSFVLAGAKAPSRAEARQPRQVQDLVATSKSILSQDLVRRWTVQDLAGTLGCSTRSLQRRYSDKSTTFSALVGEARLEAAAAFLCADERMSLAEIGFLAGYTDQAHFSRSFAHQVGTTPKAFQSSFAT